MGLFDDHPMTKRVGDHTKPARDTISKVFIYGEERVVKVESVIPASTRSRVVRVRTKGKRPGSTISTDHYQIKGFCFSFLLRCTENTGSEILVLSSEVE